MLRKILLSILSGYLILVAPQAVSTPLQNGGLSSFTGWDAFIYDGSYTAVDPMTDPHFSLAPGGAKLSNDFFYWEVALSQEFDLAADALSISFDYGWSITDSFDLVQAVLIDSASNLYNLFPAGTDFSLTSNSGTAITDISLLAGQAVTIEFLLQDGDWNEQDTFTVGNIQIETASVPEPGILLLLSIGLLGLLLGARQVTAL